jgi:hypothetical protein
MISLAFRKNFCTLRANRRDTFRVGTMSWAVARTMTERKRPAPEAPKTRRNVDELLETARTNEARALARFQRKNATVQKYEALKHARNRKLETRRKIIAGALVLKHMKYDASFAAAFEALLDRYVEKGPERMLFGLAVKPKRLGNP